MDEGNDQPAVPPNTPDLEPASSESGDHVGRLPPDPLSSKVPVPSAELNMYRAAVALRAVLLGFFLRYRAAHPVLDAYGLWLASVACESWLALSWLAGQLPKLFPTNRATRLDRLAMAAMPIPSVDVFVSAADAAREPPLATVNTVLSVLAADYHHPAGRLACYVSDDGADMLLFEALFEAARFARKWVPFCRRHSVEPRAPELYFARSVDYLRDKVAPSFVKERRAMKTEYEELKTRMSYLASRARKVPEEGWVMADGTPWPGNNPRDHPAMIQVILGHTDDRDAEGNELPRLFYVSREKRPGFQHHKKAGAMNALLRVSAVLTNGAYVLNLDYDHYVNNSRALREAMCFLMDPETGSRTCFVQFPLRLTAAAAAAAVDGSGEDWCTTSGGGSVFFDIDMKCLDGIQGPVYVGSGCCFNRKALYGFEPAAAASNDDDDTSPRRWNWWCFGREKRALFFRRTMSAVPLLDSEEGDEEEIRGARRRRLSSYRVALERHFGQSPVFIASAFGEQGRGGGPLPPAAVAASPLLKEAIHVVSCAYEERTRWGKEIGWVYGAGTGGAVATGFSMHARGWVSAYCVPALPAFRSYAVASMPDVLAGASRRAVAAMGILLSRRHCPVWPGGSMRALQRLAYVNCVAYPLSSLPLTIYCALSAVFLLTGKSIFPDDVCYYDGVLLILLLSSVVASVALELKWSGVSLQAWWQDEKLWVVTGTSACLAAVFQGILRSCTGIDIGFSTDTETAAPSRQQQQQGKHDGAAADESTTTRSVRWTNLLVPPMSVLLGNLAGVVVAVSYGVDHGYQSWSPLAGKLVLAGWVVAHLQGFLRGLLTPQRGRAPTLAVLWSVLLVSVLSLLWVNVQTYYAP